MASPAPIELANLGMADSLILMVLALVVFGPRRLPQIGRQIGKLMYEFRKASNDFKFQMEEELRLSEEADRRKKEEAERQQAALAAPAQTVEAQADIGATEAAKNLTEPEEDEAVHLPRVAAPLIQPPSIGATVAAARPNGAATAASAPAAEAAIQSEANTEDAEDSALPPSEPTQSEPANQHG